MRSFLIFFVSESFSAQGNAIPASDTGSMVLRLFLSLVLIVGLIYLSLYLLKKSSLGFKKKSSGELIQILERCYLSPKKGIFVVKIGSKVLALGVSDTQINLLTELSSNPETAPDLKEKPNPEQKSSASFFQKLKDKLG